jgi:hypothetical protein
MTQTQNPPERAIRLVEQLDGAVRFTFESLSLNPMYGPADRYGVIEWHANVPDFARFIPSGLDTGDADLDAAIAAWSESENTATDYETVIQVTIAARTPKNLVRWAFPPLTLPDLQSDETGYRVRDALRAALESSRTYTAVWSVLSPENAPSDMEVLPLIAEKPRPPIIGDEGF